MIISCWCVVFCFSHVVLIFVFPLTFVLVVVFLLLFLLLPAMMFVSLPTFACCSCCFVLVLVLLFSCCDYCMVLACYFFFPILFFSFACKWSLLFLLPWLSLLFLLFSSFSDFIIILGEFQIRGRERSE